MLWERDNLAVKAGFAACQHFLQILQVFQAGGWLNVAMAAGSGGTVGLNQIDQLFGPLLGIRLQFRQQLLLQPNHIFDGGARWAIQRTPWAAVKGFVQMDVHITHGGQHQFAASVVNRQRAVCMLAVIAQGNDLALVDLQRFQFGASSDRGCPVKLKTRL
ncbi:hypothetical protein D3C80_1174350 [compost metagenome]